ncbi:hypothetical protein A0H81_12523 [Grifola frondosa]|uniref:Uncharacterized protein n=1 Tax=Grifola frondosa TaxID=5627 RepID=A0A1C7LTP5_GRIFR|nr:hypothetical protein A0H81_12523 [Grifola frondosa]
MDRGIESGLVFGALEREQLMKEVAHLKADIQSRTAEFSGLRAEHASLAAEHKELQALLSSRNSRLDILQAEVEQTRQSLARSDSVAEDLRESLEAEKSRLLAAEGRENCK